MKLPMGVEGISTSVLTTCVMAAYVSTSIKHITLIVRSKTATHAPYRLWRTV